VGRRGGGGCRHTIHEGDTVGENVPFTDIYTYIQKQEQHRK
jgi:hypothetical protein